MSKDFLETLRIEFEKEGFILEKKEMDQFVAYKDYLVEYNEKVNLTAITDDFGVITKHFLDSCLLLKYFDVKENASLIDVGAGAGFPSVPIKILRPSLSITMIDSLKKRMVFLDLLLEKLGIQGRTVHLRGEDGGNDPEFRESFDYATARAVTNLRELAEITLPLVKVDGYFLALKGELYQDGEEKEELKKARPAIKALGGEIIEVKQYKLTNDQERTLVIIKKIKTTPKKYPRPWGRILKSPIMN